MPNYTASWRWFYHEWIIKIKLNIFFYIFMLADYMNAEGIVYLDTSKYLK